MTFEHGWQVRSLIGACADFLLRDFCMVIKQSSFPYHVMGEESTFPLLESIESTVLLIKGPIHHGGIL